eukprot:TRINITY_DN21922_c0_g1_i5.p2 TRINITY_DN21922_c0_g1~~TRINITY_DN21922_c0_g1_i5.p2  ORF type:complete len:115 (+),score=2.13 TRINITY_DN21922_c0_g1_i5:348-692(+)
MALQQPQIQSLLMSINISDEITFNTSQILDGLSQQRACESMLFFRYLNQRVIQLNFQIWLYVLSKMTYVIVVQVVQVGLEVKKVWVAQNVCYKGYMLGVLLGICWVFDWVKSKD